MRLAKLEGKATDMRKNQTRPYPRLSNTTTGSTTPSHNSSTTKTSPDPPTKVTQVKKLTTPEVHNKREALLFTVMSWVSHRCKYQKIFLLEIAMDLEEEEEWGSKDNKGELKLIPLMVH